MKDEQRRRCMFSVKFMSDSYFAQYTARKWSYWNNMILEEFGICISWKLYDYSLIKDMQTFKKRNDPWVILGDYAFYSPQRLCEAQNHELRRIGEKFKDFDIIIVQFTKNSCIL